MVSIRKAKRGHQLRKRGAHDWFPNTKEDREKLGLLAVGVTIGFFFVVVFQGVFGGPKDEEIMIRGQEKSQSVDFKVHPQLKDSSRVMGEPMNALALDIFETLDCESLFEKTLKSNNEFEEVYEEDLDDWKKQDRRRLEEEEQQHGDDGGFDFDNRNNNIEKEKTDDGGEDWGKDAQALQAAKTDDKWGLAVDKKENEWGDDKWRGFNDAEQREEDEFRDYDNYMSINGRHLFCLAASPEPPEKISSSLKCDAAGVKRKTLLDLWSAARAQIADKSILTRVLDVAVEHSEQNLLGKEYNLWSPQSDQGIEYILRTLNSDNIAENKGLNNLSESLGPGKLFVDIGSCLGLTTLAIAGKYPGTQIASIEPASPNWLLQEMNLRCNLDHDDFKKVKVVLAGVGPNDSDEDNMMAKLLWRASSTTSARAWTPAAELQDQSENDIELVVRLRKLKSVLAEADVYGPHTIDVLNVDCSGCEYNLIPALTDEEFDAIPTILGGVHWGYIPKSKLPSSSRAKLTHERLCRHENIARATKECCAFPNMEVQSSIPGEILIQDVQDRNGALDKPSTVQDIIMENLCDDFDEWRKEKYLDAIESDWGWFELTSHAN